MLGWRIIEPASRGKGHKGGNYTFILSLTTTQREPENVTHTHTHAQLVEVISGCTLCRKDMAENEIRWTVKEEGRGFKRHFSVGLDSALEL